MHILVINCGSSSVKAECINTVNGRRILSMRASRILSEQPELSFSDEEETRICSTSGHEAVLGHGLPILIEKLAGKEVKGIGHRVVHGGEAFAEAVLIDEKVEQTIEELISLAPLHNPINLLGIRIAKQYFPDLPHVAVFDTAFHSTLPTRAKTYALPIELAEKHGLRRYGFHGTSHQYVANKAAEYLQADVSQLRIITCHLGNGASVTAVEYGRSIETSMGMTPLEGLVMGTRSGDVDAGILVYLMEKEGFSAEEVNRLLNKESGLKGLSGLGNDMRDIEQRAAKGDRNCQLAIHVFAHRLRKYIGAYAALMGGVDAIVFTGGIGENSAGIRRRVVQRMEYMGAILNPETNRSAQANDAQAVIDISAPYSRCRILAVRTDEQYAIAQQTSEIVAEFFKVNTQPVIPIAVSARHVHVTQEVVNALFGEGYQLTVYRPLSQPGQFAANERVTLIGPRNEIKRVRILGPCRSKNQVEISRTDEFFLGIDAPVRRSGHVKNTPGVILEGPAGRYELKEGVICAWRHIHMTPEDAEQFGVENKDIVEVRVEQGDRSLTFGNVLIRVSPKYKLEMHIDTDEANAAELSKGAEGVLVSTTGSAQLVKRGRIGKKPTY